MVPWVVHYLCVGVGWEVLKHKNLGIQTRSNKIMTLYVHTLGRDELEVRRGHGHNGLA
jgi:hypothetical protein